MNGSSIRLYIPRLRLQATLGDAKIRVVIS